MRTTTKLAVLGLIAATAIAAGAAEGNLRYTITVTEFDNEAGWSSRWDLGEAWGTIMTDLLQQTDRFVVLGEADMRQAALDEQDFAASGRTAGGSKAPVTGQMTPAQLLVKGAITHVEEDTKGGRGGIRVKGIRLGGGGGSAEINAVVQIVDSTTGQIVASQRCTGTANRKGLGIGYSGRGFGGDFDAFQKDNVGKAVTSAVEEAVEWMVDQLPSIPWTGTVARVIGDNVLVNRGTREGVAPGQRFVVGHSEVIRDPDTGEVLDEFMEEVAVLQVDQVKEKISYASVTSGDIAGIDRGMAVHLP